MSYHSTSRRPQSVGRSLAGGILNTYSSLPPLFLPFSLCSVRCAPGWLAVRWGFLRLWGNRDVLTSSDAPFMRKATTHGGGSGKERDEGREGSMTSGKSACYTRQKMLPPPPPPPPLYIRRNKRTKANGRQFLNVYSTRRDGG